MTKPGGPRRSHRESAWRDRRPDRDRLVLQRSPVMLPIPGTAQVAHVEENVAAASLSLTPAEIAQLDKAA